MNSASYLSVAGAVERGAFGGDDFTGRDGVFVDGGYVPAPYLDGVLENVPGVVAG